MTTSALRQRVVDWLDDNYHFGDTEQMLAGDEEKSFLANGILDSLGFVKLMLFLEDTFAVQIDRKDIRPDNFDSLAKIVRYVSVLPGFRLAP
jgi:acyl carrier protein